MPARLLGGTAARSCRSRCNSSKSTRQRRTHATAAGYAPYLDYRPLTEDELPLLPQIPEPAWLRSELENKVLEYAIQHLVPSHFAEVRRRKEELVDKTTAAVKDRLTQEIRYWDHRAIELKEQELAGKVNARLNSGLARQRADDLAARLQKRMGELEQERKLSPLPPVVSGAALIVPVGLLQLGLKPGQAGASAHVCRRYEGVGTPGRCRRHGRRTPAGFPAQGRE